MITKEDINKALNFWDGLTVDYGNRNAQEIEELDNAIDVIYMAAQAYANTGADDHAKTVQYEKTMKYAEGYSQARKDLESIIAGQGVIFQETDADLTAREVLTIKPKHGEPVQYERRTGPTDEK